VRLAHISDLHFSTSTFGLSQFFSKRWIGNLNLLLSRKKDYLTERLFSLPALFQELKVTHVVISGDLSTTSLEKEFTLASDFIHAIRAADIEVFAIPGNHDHYTKQASRKKLFYKFFEASYTPENQTAVFGFNLKDHRVTARQIDQKLWLVALDTALATPLVSSRGLFSEEMEANLEELLSQIPTDHRVLMLNHFPLFHHETPRKILLRADALRAQIQRFPQVKVYLHGHTHRHCIADLRASNHPLILDSGSTTHKEQGSWNLLDIDSTGCSIEVFTWKEDAWKGQHHSSLIKW
jgi:3',5'-cyclic AMP phosphodiesterase CpdA